MSQVEFNHDKRIHSLDALRAIMMMLGIVLHSSETYNVGTNSMWPKDPNASSLLMNYISSIIHIFRMPSFFLIAGFFGALLFYERSPIKMIKNRVVRIVFPFLVFLAILHPVILSTIDFAIRSFGITDMGFSTEITLYPQMTYHLWFLYYLIWITFFAFLLAELLKKTPAITQRILIVFDWLSSRRLFSILIMWIVIFILLVWMWNYWAPTPLTFAIDIKVFIFYSIFYFMGWLLFQRKQLLNSFMKNDWLFTTIAVVIYTLKFVFKSEIGDVIYGGLNALVIWFFLFGITGLFVRYTSSYSKRWRYISDASYWVYLIHLPFTLLIPAIIADWPIPAILKFLVVMISTTAVCFISYHYLVRNSFIGKFLNGKRYRD